MPPLSSIVSSQPFTAGSRFKLTAPDIGAV
jgi:hypothetical protein